MEGKLGPIATMGIWKIVIDICVTTSQAWPIQLLCFVLLHRHPSAHFSGWVHLQTPGGLWHLMEAEVLDRKWSLCTPVARPISCSLVPFFTLSLELNVNQEHWADWRSGSGRWFDPAIWKENLTAGQKGRRHQKRTREEEFWDGAEGGLRPSLSRWLDRAFLKGRRPCFPNDGSRRRRRRPVALQRAAPQCLSQHINNSTVLESVYVNKCAHRVMLSVGASFPFIAAGETYGGCVRF